MGFQIPQLHIKQCQLDPQKINRVVFITCVHIFIVCCLIKRQTWLLSEINAVTLALDEPFADVSERKLVSQKTFHFLSTQIQSRSFYHCLDAKNIVHCIHNPRTNVSKVDDTRRSQTIFKLLVNFSACEVLHSISRTFGSI